MNFMEKLLLLDGNSMLFRAYYATLYTHRMSTSNGIPTNAIYGFIMMFNKAIEIIQPDSILVAWDADSQTFRKEEYPAYKGTRKPLDDELIVQFPIVREFLESAGIQQYEIHGYEADDIIGSMAKQANANTTIVSSDRDLLQLVDDTTHVLLMKKGLSDMELMDVKAFQEKYELNPIQIIDMKGLMGDTSDNIPGVAGVGEKTAIRLLKQYPSVEEVYENVESVKGKLKEKLIKDKDNAFLSKHLATIYRDMELPFTLEDCHYSGMSEEVNDFYLKYEMRSLATKKETKEEQASELIELSSWTIQSDLLVPVCTNASYLQQTLFGFMGMEKGNVYFISTENAKKDKKFNAMLKKSNEIMTWDMKELMHVLSMNGFDVRPFKEDLHIASFLLHSQATNQDALMDELHIYLPESFHELTLTKKAKEDIQERVKKVMHSFVQQLEPKISSILDGIKKENLTEIYRNIELPLIPILYQMEVDGIDIDEAVLDEIDDEVVGKMETFTQQIYEYAGHEFNVNSPKQLAVVLYDELELKKPGKKRSTSVDVLEKLKDQHPMIGCLMEYRKYAKIKSTYIDGLKKHIQEDHKIHTCFNQTMTQTGRLSSSEPNLQNISVRDEEGKMIRKAFKAKEGYVLLSADYSQIELRMLAHMANEEHMIEAFNNDEDIHTRTATLIFDCDKEDVTPDKRRMAKTVNFGIVYGQTEFGLASQLGISRLEAREFMNAYFSKYSNIHQYMNQLIEYCKEHGYVQTLFHRTREIPEINDKNFMTREFGKRAAMNAPIQGTAADLIKIAMIKVDQAMKEANVKSKMLLQIHDELIFIVPEEELDTMIKLVKETMENAWSFNVPLKASLAYGTSWYEAK